jgi:hypothetical protein
VRASATLCPAVSAAGLTTQRERIRLSIGHGLRGLVTEEAGPGTGNDGRDWASLARPTGVLKWT